MSRIFLSHSSLDSREAVALKTWLAEEDPTLADEIFLDLDRRGGIATGARWKEALKRANARCEAVICLLSANWEASTECRVEYRTAENLNKQIFCGRLDPSTGQDVTSEWQRCDLFGEGPSTEIPVEHGPPVVFATDGLLRLHDGICGAGISAQSFVWPPRGHPERAPFRGWEPFEEIDAGVFFGRDAQIVRALDSLRGMRRSEINTLFVVLGPSGTGKSSFLRAGLLPRLRREDRRYLLLGIVRPARHALTGETGLAQAIYVTRQRLGLLEPSLGEIKAACRGGDTERIRAWFVGAQKTAAATLVDDDPQRLLPTVVLPLDQAEELLSADAGPEAPQFLRLIHDLAEPGEDSGLELIVAATIRTDRYDIMQTAPELTGLGSVLFDDLKPMPPTQFKEVITGPAARTGDAYHTLHIDPRLVDQLLADASADTTEGGDTLPLLSLTLSRLFNDYGATGELNVAQYEQMGGMRHVVQTEIDEILSPDPAERATQLSLLRAAFIPWLATINPANDQPLRRMARWKDLPEASRPLIDAFVAKRLMVKDHRGGETVVEVALESLLRQWDELAGWLHEQRGDLETAEDIERAAAAWNHSGGKDAWLLEGARLEDAEKLTESSAFRERLAPALDYLAASRRRENDRLQAEQRRQQAELQTTRAHAAAMRKRSRVLQAVLAVTAAVAVVAVLAFTQAEAARRDAQDRFRQATALRLTSESADMIAGTKSGGDVRAFQELLAARALVTNFDDGELLHAVATRARTLKIVDIGTVAEDIAVSGRRAATAGDDGTVRLWDIDTGHAIGRPLTGPTGTVHDVAFSSDGHRVAAASDDSTVRVWNADTGQPIGIPLTGHTGAVWSVAFSPDGHRVASAGADGTVRLWNADIGQPVGPPLTGHTGPVYDIAFSPDGRHVASAGGDGTVRLWDADTRQPDGPPLTGHINEVYTVVFSPDGHRLASGGEDKTVRLWDIDTHQPIGAPLTGHTAFVNCVAFSPDGHLLASAGGDDTIRVWDADRARPIGPPLTGHTNQAAAVAFSGDGHRLVTDSADGTLRVWDATQLLAGHTADVWSVAFSPDGHRLASASGDTTVRLWDVDTDQPIGTPLTGHTDPVLHVAFSPDGRRLATTSADGTLRWWDADTGRPVGGTPPMGHLGGVAFSPDAHRLAVAVGNLVQLWNIDNGGGQPMGAPLAGHTDLVNSVVFSPDGHRIASASDDHTVRLWNADTGQPIGAPLTGHTYRVDSVAFSPDGHRLASTGSDETVLLWNVDTGQPIGAPLIGHTAVVQSVTFSPDGRRLASASDDGTLRLWNADTGQPIGAPLIGHTSAILSVAFSPDGRLIATASADGTVRLWPASATPELLCDKFTANMSHKQWHDWISPAIGYIPLCAGLPIPSD
jgi:WD40 repeat protein